MEGIKQAAAELGLSDSIVWKYKVPEDQTCYDSALDLVGQGCNLIISNSYGHQSYMALAAEEYPDVTFVAMTGDFAALSGLDNLKNAFTKVYQSRYVSGVVAGMKLAEMLGRRNPLRREAAQFLRCRRQCEDRLCRRLQLR